MAIGGQAKGAMTDFLDTYRGEPEIFQWRLDEAPSQSLVMFMPGAMIAVECGPTATGAVWAREPGEDLLWVAPSLTRLFEQFLDYNERGLVEWDQYGAQIELPDDLPNRRGLPSFVAFDLDGPRPYGRFHW